MRDNIIQGLGCEFDKDLRDDRRNSREIVTWRDVTFRITRRFERGGKYGNVPRQKIAGDPGGGDKGSTGNQIE